MVVKIKEWNSWRRFIMTYCLTEREVSVLFYLVHGYNNVQIAQELNISIHTVKAHLEAIYEKLHVTNRVQAAILVIKLGIIDLDNIVMK